MKIDKAICATWVAVVGCILIILYATNTHPSIGNDVQVSGYRLMVASETKENLTTIQLLGSEDSEATVRNRGTQMRTVTVTRGEEAPQTFTLESHEEKTITLRGNGTKNLFLVK